MASTVTGGAGAQQVTAVSPAAQDRVHRIVMLLAPALAYLGVRQIGLLVLAWTASRNGVAVGSELASWDGQWFLALAATGYDGVTPELTDAFGRRSAETPLAFFPGYPALVAAVAWLPGVSLLAAALSVTVAAGVTCAYGLARLVRALPFGSPEVRQRGGLVLVALFAAAPMGVVLSMAYSEALFCALAVWTLVGVLERRWLLAGVCCAAAGLVRPTAAALVVAVALAALVAGYRDRDRRPWAALALAPAGLLGYLGFVGWRTGRADGWFVVQEQGWKSGFDGGSSTLRFTVDTLATAPSVLEVVTVAVLTAAVVLLAIAALSWRRSAAWPLLVYATVVVAMGLGSDGLMNSKARLLLPAFVLLIPPALGLARRQPATAVAVLAGLTVSSAWFGAYSLTIWPYAI